jgi:hypothetical protein
MRHFVPSSTLHNIYIILLFYPISHME